MKLAIVSTLYNSPNEVPELIDRCVKVGKEFAGDDFEIILIDDACPQHSADVAEEHGRGISQLRVVRLARNFGQHHALMEGFRQSTGEFVFALDGDLEEEPEWLFPFHQEMKKSPADVIYGYQQRRRGGPTDGFLGLIGYGLIRYFTKFKFKPNLVTARLMTREYVDALISFQERVVWLAGLWELTGFVQRGVPVIKKNVSRSNYSQAQKFRHLVASILGNSRQPLNFVFAVGGLGAVISVVLTSIIVVGRFFGERLEGWASILASLWIIGGLVLFSLSIMAFYLSTIFEEVKSRPHVIVRKSAFSMEDS